MYTEDIVILLGHYKFFAFKLRRDSIGDWLTEASVGLKQACLVFYILKRLLLGTIPLILGDIVSFLYPLDDISIVFGTTVIHQVSPIMCYK